MSDKPLVQIDDLIREMTEEEFEDYKERLAQAKPLEIPAE